MSDKIRWKYGDTNPVVAVVDSVTVIEIGDLLWQDIDDAKSALMIPNAADWKDGDLKLSLKGLQARFVDSFLGVAMSGSCSGDTALIRVATTGVFEFDCPGGAFELGDLVGADQAFCEEVPDGLLNQQVVKVTLAEYAVARVAKREASIVTSVLVDIRSRVMGIGIE